MKSSEAMIITVRNYMYERIFSNWVEKPENSGLQRSYEPSDVGSWSFVGSNVLAMNNDQLVFSFLFFMFLGFKDGQTCGAAETGRKIRLLSVAYYYFIGEPCSRK